MKATRKMKNSPRAYDFVSVRVVAVVIFASRLFPNEAKYVNFGKNQFGSAPFTAAHKSPFATVVRIAVDCCREMCAVLISTVECTPE